MAIYYVENENGRFLSNDGSRRFMKLCGRQAYEYLKSAEGQTKRFMRTSSHEDGGEEEFVEVPPAFIRQHRKDERHEQYVSDCMENSGLITISLYAMEDDKDRNLYSGEELVADPSSDIEAQVLHEINLEILHRALKALTDEELYLIEALYLMEKRYSEQDLAILMGVSQQAISKKRLRVLAKLRSFF
ncbi:MAG: sigma-70 family RNA polymerase sigma factor [Oscillospiraceae bacterium]|nr:sigma-70 family RNA polymerase sigma factor [Oscillospiraceae bacterium]